MIEAVAYGAAIQGGILSGEGGEETKVNDNNVVVLLKASQLV